MEFGKQIDLIGRVGSLPKIANEINGRKLVRFVIANTTKCISNGRYTQRTQWHTVNIIGLAADEILNDCLHIGDNIIISGNWLIDNYTDQFGNKRYRYEIYAESVEKTYEEKENVA